ncbi:ribonuclease P protein subunit rpr2 [Lucilia sericata]|uniref:ribonuclease P protein subunit rpr2 n=1 Tax=Lucilia sericata TaxID=13632 RepID=UPI0018A80F19|nr:ribonuclease P protein subunit rpr2 [Lucilia sericata]
MSQTKTKHHFQGKECFSRMNFLYQASLLMAGKNNALSSYYGELCKNVGKKAVLRIDPTVKRDLCKRCSLAQKPGITSDLNVKSLRKKRRKPKDVEHLDQDCQMQMACKLCGYQRNFNVKTEYKFWLENPESVAEVCNIKTEEKQNNNIKVSNDKVIKITKTDKNKDKD